MLHPEVIWMVVLEQLEPDRLIQGLNEVHILAQVDHLRSNFFGLLSEFNSDSAIWGHHPGGVDSEFDLGGGGAQGWTGRSFSQKVIHIDIYLASFLTPKHCDRIQEIRIWQDFWRKGVRILISTKFDKFPTGTIFSFFPKKLQAR